jgi:hypothetical protein
MRFKSIALGLSTVAIYSLIVLHPHGIAMLALAWMIPIWALLVWETILKGAI